jgi:hypothetical protein
MLAYERADGGRSRMLEVQYRMHQDISDWASVSMYNGKLVSHESVRNRLLATLPWVVEKSKSHLDTKKGSCALEKVTLMLIDTTGCDMHETANEAGSRYNEGEASIVASHVQSLLSIGLRADDIAIITPYNGQVELLRKMLLPSIPQLEIRSVDGFQGGEREAVVLSLVRSSDRRGQDGIGFLRDERRLNVAVTRAKRHCAVVCDCETVSKNAFIKGLLDWMENKGEYRSGAEFTKVHHASSGSLHPAIGIPQKQLALNKERPRSQKSSKELVVKTKIDRKLSKNEPKDIKGEMKDLPSDIVIASGCDDDEVTSHPETGAVEEETNHSHSSEKSLETKIKSIGQLDDEEENNDQNDAVPNKLLQALAIERQNRHTLQTSVPSKNQPKMKKAKAKGRTVGGAKPSRKQETSIDKFDDLDDMAFLDAQIEKAQTSHGRTIDANGKGYRTIVSPP